MIGVHNGMRHSRIISGERYMHTILTLVLLTMPFLGSRISAAQAAHPAPAEPRISITIKISRSGVKVGSNVDVEVEMKNISSEGVGFVPAGTMSFSSTSFRWDIRDSGGKPVPMTEWGLKANCLDSPGGVPRICAGSSFSDILDPGKSFTQKLALSKEYDLSKPSKYTIQALHSDGKADVQSNFISLTVTP